MPRCLIVQHVEVEGAYAIGVALDEAGVAVDVRRVHAGDPVPADLSAHDGLVVMGGPMAADSDDGFPSRRAELALLRDALDRGRPVLGVCLGAQLLALAAGGAVRRGESGPEVGWGPVELTAEGRVDRLFSDLPTSLEVLQWHSDTFDAPAAACVLAANAAYATQAMRVGAVAWGLQFHVEVDEDAVAAFLEAFGTDADDLPGGRHRIEAATPEAVARLAPARRQLLGRFAQLVAVSEPGLVGSA